MPRQENIDAGNNRGAAEASIALPFHALQDLLTACPLPIISVDRDGQVTSWNPAAERLFGWSEEEVLGRRLPVVPPEYSPEAQTIRIQTEEGHSFQDVEVVRQRRDGSHLTLSLSTAPLHDDSGQSVGSMLTYADLSEHKAAQETLRRQAAILRERAALLQLTHEALFVRELDTGIIRFWNRGAETLYGWMEEEATGAVSHQLLQTVFPEPLTTIDSTLLRTGRWDGELEHTTRDGRRIIVSSRWSLHHDEEGRPVGALEGNTDITERKLAEDALRRSEARFRTLVEASPVGVSIINDQGVIEEINSSFETLLGYAPGAVDGMHHSAFFPADQQAALVRARAERFATNMEALDEFQLRRMDGTRVTVLMNSVPLQTLDGTPRRAAFVMDISDRKRSELILQRSEEQLRTLIDQAPVGICTIVADGIFEQVNDAYAAVLGYRPDELIGQHFSVVAPAEQLASMRADYRQRLKDATGSLSEAQVVSKDGKLVTLLATTIPLIGVDGTQRRVSFVLDITERKVAERLLQHRADHDALTGLGNRTLLQDRLEWTLAESKRRGEIAGLLFFDLDGFKSVNDRLGHERGDEFLRLIARALVKHVRSSDTVARLGGDEFVVVLANAGSAQNVAAVAEKLLESLRHLTNDAVGADVSASVGISLYPAHGQTGEQLLARADEAMYEAKARGKNRYALYGADWDR